MQVVNWARSNGISYRPRVLTAEDRDSDPIITGCTETPIFQLKPSRLRREIAAQHSLNTICSRSRMLGSTAFFEETP